MLEAYYALFARVFPIAGEIETVAAYDEYLRDPASEWDVVVLSDASDGRTIGGIQWQAIRNVGASWIDELAWIEHVWLIDEPSVRRYDTFRQLLQTVRKHMRAKRVDTGFMEFNDPEKMTAAELEQDRAGGLSSWDRLVLWARVGLCDVTYRTEEGQRLPVPYAQPAMEGGAAVRILSLGFFALATDLTRMHLRAHDYLRILHRAHATIRGVDPAIDPTCLEYKAAVQALGVAELDFVPLKERLARRPGRAGVRATAVSPASDS